MRGSQLGELPKLEQGDDQPMTAPPYVGVLGVSRPALSMLLNGRSDLAGTMALRIEKAFGVKMETLMRMQSSYDIARTPESGRGGDGGTLSSYGQCRRGGVRRAVRIDSGATKMPDRNLAPAS